MSQAPLLQILGFKYYAFFFNLLLYVGVYELTQSMEIVLLAVALVPRLGTLLPDDDLPKQKNAKQYNKNFIHMLAPVGSVLQLFFMLYYTWTNYEKITVSYQSIISSLLALGIAGGPTIDASHQLIHRNQIILKSIGFISLIPFQFTTYPVQHLYMHHKKVGTAEDDITAPKNMPFYIYYVKAVWSSYRETYNYSKIFFVFCICLQMSYLFGLYQFALNEYNGNESMAIGKVGYFLSYAFVGLFFMQSIQYIQHYGLIYRKDNQEKPVLEISSWNTTSNPIYNWSIFRFQRHSDHHMNAYKLYSTLELNQKMPLFPFSFPQGMATAWIPNLWYRSANHLVDKVLNHEKLTQQDLSKSKFWVYVSNGIVGVFFIANAWLGYTKV